MNNYFLSASLLLSAALYSAGAHRVDRAQVEHLKLGLTEAWRSANLVANPDSKETVRNVFEAFLRAARDDGRSQINKKQQKQSRDTHVTLVVFMCKKSERGVLSNQYQKHAFGNHLKSYGKKEKTFTMSHEMRTALQEWEVPTEALPAAAQ